MQKSALLIFLTIWIAVGRLAAQIDTTKFEDWGPSASQYFLEIHAREHPETMFQRTIIRQTNVLNPKSNRKWKCFRTVIVEGDKIVKLRSSIFPTRKKGARVIKARKQFLIPGMTDMHLHHMCADKRLELLLLMNGITSAREMNGWVNVDLQRDLIRRNKLLWPDYFVTKTQYLGLNVNFFNQPFNEDFL